MRKGSDTLALPLAGGPFGSLRGLHPDAFQYHYHRRDQQYPADGKHAAGTVNIKHRTAASRPGANGQLNRGHQQPARALRLIRDGRRKPGRPANRDQTESKAPQATSMPSSTARCPNATSAVAVTACPAIPSLTPRLAAIGVSRLAGKNSAVIRPIPRAPVNRRLAKPVLPAQSPRLPQHMNSSVILLLSKCDEYRKRIERSPWTIYDI